MQAVSAELAAALTSRERTIVFRVKADWKRDGTFVYDPGVFNDTYSDTYEAAGDMGDLSRFVDSVSVDRSLSTDLPESAKVGTGYGAAEASMTLAGSLDSGMKLSRALGAQNGGAPFTRRISAPIYVEIGAVGAAGPEYVRTFTGRIRSIGNEADGSLTLSALDGRERLRTPVNLPIVSGQTGNYFLTQITTPNGVTPTAETSLNTGISTPLVESSDPWELLQQLAAAELGVVLFDENDTLRFYNRDHMVGGSAVTTVTTDSAVSFANLKAISSEESADSVRNYVTVPAAPQILDPAGTEIWRMAEVIGVPATSTIVVPVQFDAPAHTISVVTYVACTLVDGSGTNITNIAVSYTSTSSTTGNITLYNPNAFDVFIVYDTAAPGPGVGLPALVVTGRLLRPGNTADYTAVQQSPDSQAYYGLQSLDVGANPWRQSLNAATGLAIYLVATLREPHATLSGVDVVGDPRLQLTDRVRVTDPDGLSFDKDHWVVGINTRVSTSDGLAQSLTLREAS